MKKNIIKDLGTISIENLVIVGGQIEVFIPIEAISDELDAVIVKCRDAYKENYPEVKEIATNTILVFTMGYANPEFELHIQMFEDETGENFEEYDNSFLIGDIELSEEQKKQIKKVMWDKLGETLLSL